MNRRDLVDAIASRADLDRQTADAALTAVLTAVTTTLANGEKVTLPGFGTFETRARSARSGRNPQTGETIAIAASNVPAFKAGSALKQAVADGR